ncbi:MAG: hypothetical protein ABI273_16165 [Lacunisphaera sp.]
MSIRAKSPFHHHENMTTPQQVLFDLNVVRLRADDEERNWTRLRRDCQLPAILGITGVVGLLVLCVIGMRMLKIHPGDWKDLAALFTPGLLMALGVVMAYQRKQKALMKLIDAEAPELSKKLKTKGIF